MIKDTIDYLLFIFLIKELQESRYNVKSLQKATADFRAQFEDFRVEQAEDIAEIKRTLRELKRNKVWLPRETV